MRTIRDVGLDTVPTGNLRKAGGFLTLTAEVTSSRVFNHHRHRKMHRSGVLRDAASARGGSWVDWPQIYRAAGYGDSAWLSNVVCHGFLCQQGPLSGVAICRWCRCAD